MWHPPITVTLLDDPVQCAELRDQLAAFKRNSDWASAHWPDLLPQARGKFVAVAGQEAFIADTAQEAEMLATNKHPHEKGLFVQYVFPFKAVRFSSNRVCYSGADAR